MLNHQIITGSDINRSLAEALILFKDISEKISINENEIIPLVIEDRIDDIIKFITELKLLITLVDGS